MALFRKEVVDNDCLRFKYTPLSSPTSVRLLEMKSKPFGGIKYSLRVVELGKAPPFNALSYTWGNPMTPFSETNLGMHTDYAARCHLLLCDGHTLHITANLNDALRALWNVNIKPAGATKLQHIWIDAICINQEDRLERAAQVSIMAEIYKSAESVIVWLGKKDEFTRDALTAIGRISRIPEDKHTSVKFADWYDQDNVFISFGLFPLSYTHWLGLLAFLNRPWFKRAWVAQETILARRVAVICGTHLIPWNEISKVVSFLVATNWYNHLHTTKMKSFDAIKKKPGPYRKLLETETNVGMAALYLVSTRTGISKQHHLAIFYYLLQAHRHCEASDPRDMIYALLGLAWKERRPFTTHPNAIVPDYEIPVQELYIKVAKVFLQSYEDLRFLSDVQDPALAVTKDLPSWVPDFSVKIKPAPLSMRGDCKWSAAANFPWDPDRGLLNSRFLGVQGIKLDTVIEAVMHNESANADDYWSSIFRVVLHIGDYYPSPSTEVLHTRMEAFWRTLITDTYAKQHPAPIECGQMIFEQIILGLSRTFLHEEKQKLLGNKAKLVPHAQRFDEMYPAWISLLESEPDHSLFSVEASENILSAAIAKSGQIGQIDDYRAKYTQIENEIEDANGWRRLFRSSNGLLGAGVRSLAKNDEVWILAGANVPFILRPQSTGKYQLVGEAYVHGAMHGEAIHLGLEPHQIILE